MAAITAIAAITTAGLSASACRTRAASSPGAPAGGGAGSGRRVGSPATDIDVPVEDGEPTALVLIASVEGLAARRE